MNERVLPRDYTAEEMDRGEDMDFHPCSGFPHAGGTSRGTFGSPYVHRFKIFEVCRSIGDGCEHRKGDSYLVHWKFDPFTGQSLEPRRSSGGLWEQD